MTERPDGRAVRVRGAGGALQDPLTGPDRGFLPLVAVCLGAAVGPLDTAVNIAFPAIAEALGLPVAAIQWVIICYVLTYACLLLGFGRLGDVVGHRRVFVAGLIWSAAALALCALAPTLPWLLAARALQGIGTALVLSCGPALATLAYPESRRGQIVGLYMLGFAAGSAAGPLLGGLLVAAGGWPAVFWFRIPIALLALVLVLRTTTAERALDQGERLDVNGAAALALVLACLLLLVNRLAQSGPLAPLPIALATIGAAASAWLALRRTRGGQPVIEARRFRDPAFAAANAAHVLGQLASFTVFLLVPFYLVQARQLPVGTAGMVLALSPLATMAASAVAGRALGRWSPPTVGALGLFLVAGGLAIVATTPIDLGWPAVAAALAVQGAGHGLFQVAVADAVIAAMPRESRGVAGSLSMVTRTVGVVCAASIGAALVAQDGGGFPLDGFRATLGLATGAAVAAGALLAVTRRPQST